jgi:hypothetical protein
MAAPKVEQSTIDRENAEPKFNKPNIDSEAPRRTNCLSDKDDPRLAAEKHDIVDAIRAKLRIATDEPIPEKSNTEMDDPKRMIPKTDKDEPRAQKLRRDIEEPRLDTQSTDTCDPKRTKDRMDTEDPI